MLLIEPVVVLKAILKNSSFVYMYIYKNVISYVLILYISIWCIMF